MCLACNRSRLSPRTFEFLRVSPRKFRGSKAIVTVLFQVPGEPLNPRDGERLRSPSRWGEGLPCSAWDCVKATDTGAFSLDYGFPLT